MSTLHAIVLPGHQQGRQIGFPTINLDPQLWPQHLPPGVYAAIITVRQQTYVGALYFGPRLVFGETQNVLEVHLLEFDQEVYGEGITCTVHTFVRPALPFASTQELQQQLQDDIKQVRQVTQELSQ